MFCSFLRQTDSAKEEGSYKTNAQKKNVSII